MDHHGGNVNGLTPQSRENSQSAYLSVEPDLPNIQAVVLAALKRAGSNGLTDHEIVARTGGNPDTLRPRRVELVHLGVVKASGRSRPTPRGRQATVWVLRECASPEPSETPDAGEGVDDAN